MNTFSKGGVHPHDNKLTAGIAISTAGLPDVAVIPLSQHIGAPAKAIVAKGDLVKVGQKIAEAGGFVSAVIHAPVSGIVSKIDTVVDASGYARPAIYIQRDGDEWESSIDRSDSLVTLDQHPDLTAETIREAIREAGIVGMGGACFPTHVKLSPPPGCIPEQVIVNAVECEPYLTADHRLLLEHPDEVLTGVGLLMKAAGVQKGFIAIENNKPDAILLMQEKAAAYDGITVVPLKVKYPQGGEKQLIEAVTGRQVPPPPALPVNVGAIIQNVGTAYAVYEAVMKHKPLIERVVTVTGKHLSRPANLRARIGTPMSQLIEECGGWPEDTGKLIGGGPMMGKALHHADVPVCKGSSGILLMSEEESHRSTPSPCIRCAKCVAACPMGLEPYLLAKAAERDIWNLLEEHHVTSCIECGSCQFTCPSYRPLLDVIRVAKATVTGIQRARANAQQNK